MLQLWLFANTLLWPFSVGLFGFNIELNVALLTFFGAGWLWKKGAITRFSVKVTFATGVFLFLYALLAIAGPCTDMLQKSMLTVPTLTFLVLVGVEAGSVATENDWMKLQPLAVWILLLAFLGFALEMMVPDYFPGNAYYRDQGIFSGLYSEPSFVAYSLFPCLLILLETRNTQLHRIGLLSVCGLLLISRSTTLVALIVAWVLYRTIRQRNFDKSIFLALAVVLIPNLEPTVSRMAGIFNAERNVNLSSLAYLQGWQDALENLKRTNGLGLGANMMGCAPLPDVPARRAIAELYELQINSEDGTTVLSKLISEFGMSGFILFTVLVCWWIINEKQSLLKSSAQLHSEATNIQLALIFSFIATSLIRSTGYFSGSALLLVVAVAAIFEWKRICKNRAPGNENVKEPK